MAIAERHLKDEESKNSFGDENSNYLALSRLVQA